MTEIKYDECYHHKKAKQELEVILFGLKTIVTLTPQQLYHCYLECPGYEKFCNSYTTEPMGGINKEGYRK